ncbi:MAG: recombination protein RarA, partial [Synechococcaceae bacterium WB8_1B_136]|nr:recombination protein RarA [Synechococcaceae bacterium WB8_1B_136]
QLQGEVFWQPGELGWEGERRLRMQQRRAAQLAAAAESEAELGQLLSSGPEDPGLERWLQRQLGAEGQRLDRLRQQLWQNASWQRHHRVLILEARSLLWALDPLAATPEGGVVIQAASAGDAQRLNAQLQVLDSLRQPQVITASAADLAAELEPGQQFEWIAARHPCRGLIGSDLQAAMAQLTALAAPGARLRFLFSTPQLGPAGALLALGGGDATDRPLLERVQAIETPWLDGPGQGAMALAEQLAQLGWHLEWRSWEERLELELGAAQLTRWLAADAPYRHCLSQQLSPADMQRMEQRIEQHRGQRLPQALRHQLLLGSHEKAPAKPGPTA